MTSLVRRPRIDAIRRFSLGMFGGVAVLGIASCGVPADSMPPVPPPTSNDYLLGPGDQVRIITFGEQQMTGEFRVNDSGRIALPLLDTLPAKGLTAEQLAAAITRALKSSDLFKDPKVSVEVTNYRPIYILGEVSKPGQYPYQPGMTVVTAAAVAGGFTYRAVQNEFSIIRNLDSKSVEGRAERDTTVQPGDVITVYERLF